jgi:hypothetical protein
VLTVEASADKPLFEILKENKLVKSKTEYTRLEKESAIKEIEEGVFRIGKHRFIKIKRI